MEKFSATRVSALEGSESTGADYLRGQIMICGVVIAVASIDHISGITVS